MIGVVIPAHNEERLLTACLESIQHAIAHPLLENELVRVIVVLDACTDASSSVVVRSGFDALTLDVRNVGLARGAGAQSMLQNGARWLAFTDADSRAAPDWLATQMALGALGADAVCGCVSVDDWSVHPPKLVAKWAQRYRDADGHRHVHGANLGVSAQAYTRAGGFPALACGEDVALVDLLIATGANVAWSAAPRVVTSGRLDARVNGGFGTTLASWANDVDDSEPSVAL
jgi:glycosyltransferase involved in cell wall biosynthesis